MTNNIFQLLLIGNPVINGPTALWRRAFGRSRWTHMAAAAAVVGILVCFSLLMVNEGRANTNCALGISAGELLVVFVTASSLTSDAITRERELNTWESVLLTSLTPAQIFVGKIAVPVMFAMAMLLGGFVLAAINAAAGPRPSPSAGVWPFVEAQSMILALSVPLSALGCCVSSWCRRTQTASFYVLAISIGLFIVSTIVVAVNVASLPALDPYDSTQGLSGELPRLGFVVVCMLSAIGFYAIAKPGFMDPKLTMSHSGTVVSAVSRAERAMRTVSKTSVWPRGFKDGAWLDRFPRFRELVTDNPMINSPLEARWAFGRSGVGGALTRCLGLLMLAMFAAISLSDHTYGAGAALVIGGEIFVLTIGIPFLVHGAIAREREMGSWNDMVMTSLSPDQIIVGKLFRAGQFCLLLCVLGGCLSAYCNVVLRPNGVGLFTILAEDAVRQIVVAAWAMFLLIFSLYVSAVSRKAVAALGNTIGALFVYLAVVPGVGAVWASSHNLPAMNSIVIWIVPIFSFMSWDNNEWRFLLWSLLLSSLGIWLCMRAARRRVCEPNRERGQ